MRVVTGKSIINCRPSPVRSKLLSCNSQFVMFKLITHSIRHSSRNPAFISDIITCAKNTKIFYPLLAGNGGGEGKDVFGHFKIFISVGLQNWLSLQWDGRPEQWRNSGEHIYLMFTCKQYTVHTSPFLTEPYLHYFLWAEIPHLNKC